MFALTVRTATPDDFDALLPLFLGLRRFSRANNPPQTDDFDAVLDASHGYLREILARGSEGQTFVAQNAAGAFAGYLVAAVQPPNALTSSGAVTTGAIDELYIGDEHRGAGVGSALLAAADGWFRAQGAQRVEVGAYAWNTEAISFYQRHGFAVWAVTLRRALGAEG